MTTISSNPAWCYFRHPWPQDYLSPRHLALQRMPGECANIKHSLFCKISNSNPNFKWLIYRWHSGPHKNIMSIFCPLCFSQMMSGKYERRGPDPPSPQVEDKNRLKMVLWKHLGFWGTFVTKTYAIYIVAFNILLKIMQFCFAKKG